MLKTLLAATAALALSSLASSATPKYSERAMTACSGYGCQRQDYSSDGGLGRYCPPGYYPHAWPNGNGMRCESPDERYN